MIVFLILYIPILTSAQPSKYPQGYFRNPLDAPILLAGNFGECRPGHFHSGLDIKTGGRENLPVYAAAEGYVSRIKMEPGGFGHGLYITHPNGYTTLYAHLNDFAPAIQRYVRQQQYARESWTLDLSPRPDQFPVKKGEQIAWSGNTGGSTAPHLHFEIRDTKTEHPLNPQLFGFEVKDSRAPVPIQLAVYGRALSTYDQDPILLPLKPKGGIYYPASDTIEVRSGVIPVGVEVNDYMDGSNNTLAIYTADWYLGDVLQGSLLLDDIGYEVTRYMHAFVDYKMKQGKGAWIQMLYRLPGNKLNHLYTGLNQNRGALRPDTYDPLPLRIVLKDVAGNASTISCYIRVIDAIEARPCPGDRSWKQGFVTAFDSLGCRFILDADMLYDDVCGGVRESSMAGAVSSRYSILSPEIPAHHYFRLALRGSQLLPFNVRSKIAMRYSDGKATSGRAAEATGQGWYAAEVRAFGDYWLEADTTAPSLKALSAVKGDLSKSKSIAFRATDDKTSVKTFRAELDGKWLLFEQSGNTWTYIFDEHCPKGSHRLVVRAKDENGNEAKASFNFTR